MDALGWSVMKPRMDSDTLLQHVLMTIDQFNPSNRTNKLEVFFVQYADDAALEFRKEIDNSAEEIRSYLKGVERTLFPPLPKTYKALDFVVDEVVPLMRTDSFKILITVTYGTPAIDDSRNEDVINTARDVFDEMVSVGIFSFTTTVLNDLSNGIPPVLRLNFDSFYGDDMFNVVTNSKVEGNISIFTIGPAC